MININNVEITGRLTREPEMKYLPSGTGVCRLSIAHNKPRKDKSGEWIDETSFFDVEVIGKASEKAAGFNKGQYVYIEGSLKQDTWDRDGVKQSKVKITAFSVQAAEKSQSGGSDHVHAGNYTQQPGGASEKIDFPHPDTHDDVPF